MFGRFKVFKRKKSKASKIHERAARDVYSTFLAHIRRPFFYELCGIQDTADARFDLLIVHMFFVMDKTLEHEDGADFNQTLFDVLFADMDQTLREAGIGDTGVPKRMRRMMKAFNGRLHSYRETKNDPESFKAAIIKNIYDGNAEARGADNFLMYLGEVKGYFDDTPPEVILQGLQSFESFYPESVTVH